MPAEYTIIDATPVPPKTTPPPAPSPPEIKPEPRVVVPKAAEPEPARPRDRPRRRRGSVLLFLLIVLALAVSIYMSRLTPYTGEAAVETDPVMIAPAVGGTVIKIPVAENARVKSGDALLVIDPAPFAAAVAQGEARLSEIGQSIGVSTTNLAAAQARLVEASADRDRQLAQLSQALLSARGSPAQQGLSDQAAAALALAETAVDRARTELAHARTAVGADSEAMARIDDALAAIAAARTQLSRTTVHAPADGVVSGLRLAIGQTIDADETAMTFINPRQVRIVAQIRENSVELLAAGNKAEFALDALPGRILQGHLDSIDPSAAPTESEGLAVPPGLDKSQRVTLRLVFDEPVAEAVRPGSHANVVVYTGDHPTANAIGSAWIRLVSWLNYAI